MPYARINVKDRKEVRNCLLAVAETMGVFGEHRVRDDVTAIVAEYFPSTVDVRTGGLYRCCVSTAVQHGPGVEGERMTCVSCRKPTLVYHSGAWEWTGEA